MISRMLLLPLALVALVLAVPPNIAYDAQGKVMPLPAGQQRDSINLNINLPSLNINTDDLRDWFDRFKALASEYLPAQPEADAEARRKRRQWLESMLDCQEECVKWHETRTDDWRTCNMCCRQEAGHHAKGYCGAVMGREL
ncbi:hypothetical protein BZA05DRAFT_394743 [Tricharina praecox]|uniref:uncharacterized protein n=1 Tax=Tricharina praecox TaxID=43433 RepID=UPI00221E6A80|nr:uncharacterized protein BZA05DRAFT_394743 [Tricharina praecox]KAI5853782.1 hypothetical protein BZA05DRAFT_394743 [Tricharina praecox]